MGVMLALDKPRARLRRRGQHTRTPEEQACLDAFAAFLRYDAPSAGRSLSRLATTVLASLLLPAAPAPAVPGGPGAGRAAAGRAARVRRGRRPGLTGQRDGARADRGGELHRVAGLPAGRVPRRG